MKKFLIEFFRPIDTLIFNYLVRFGLIKPFLGFLATALGATKVAKSIHKKKVRAAKAAQTAKAASTITDGKKDVPGEGADKVRNALDILNKANKSTFGGVAVGPVKSAANIISNQIANSKSTPSRGQASGGTLLRSATGYGVARSAGPLRSPAGGGAGSAISPGGYGVNFARKQRKRKLRAALGYGSKIF